MSMVASSQQGATKSPLRNLRFEAEALRALCRERGISKVEVFGSALRDDFRPDSDIDLLITLCPDSGVTLWGWADIQEKLSQMFARKVDLLSRPAVERSKNWIRRNSILAQTALLYEEE